MKSHLIRWLPNLHISFTKPRHVCSLTKGTANISLCIHSNTQLCSISSHNSDSSTFDSATSKNYGVQQKIQFLRNGTQLEQWPDKPTQKQPMNFCATVKGVDEEIIRSMFSQHMHRTWHSTFSHNSDITTQLSCPGSLCSKIILALQWKTHMAKNHLDTCWHSCILGD